MLARAQALAMRRFTLLFGSLVAILLLYPYLEGFGWRGVLLNLLVTAVLAAGAWGASGRRRDLVAALALAAPWVFVTWGYILCEYSAPLEVGYLSMVAFSLFTIAVILRHVLGAERVTSDVILGAISAYLLFGAAWGFLYALVERLSAGSFSFAHTHLGGGELTWSDFVYFSFVSLTSTGYGDAAPISGHARSLAICEMIVGMMYPAALISRLASLYRSEAEER
ncbi:MAG: potassium channel family protein [Candidatus Methylomirabilis sp.]|nr:potassium channel family protein [Deltaproteobacteria bacterium]